MTHASQPGSDADHPAWAVSDVFPPNALGERAWVGFRRDLPRLLETCRGQWVAYRGEEQLGVGPKNTELYEECVRRGFNPGELVLCRVEEIVGEEAMDMGC